MPASPDPTLSVETTEPPVTSVEPDCTPVVDGDGPVGAAAGCDPAPLPAVATNPSLPDLACGLSVMIVVDASSSVDTGAVGRAVDAVVDALVDTGSTVGLVEFSATASLRVAPTVLDASTRAGFDGFVAGLSAGGSTNVEAGLAAVAAEDLTVVVTDGVFNASNAGPGQAVASAVQQANRLKAAGSRVFAVGVGAADVAGLAAISGTQAGGDVTTADYSVGDPAALVASLRVAAEAGCPASTARASAIGTAAVGEYCNTTPITWFDFIFDTVPYPSTIEVSGADPVTQEVTVQLAGITHERPREVDVLLVGPTGANIILMSDVGGGDVGGSDAVSGVTLNFSDSAADQLPFQRLTSGTFRPTDRPSGFTTFFPPPAPDRSDLSGATELATFRDLDPNGTWSLFVADKVTSHSGSIAGGWCLTITSDVNPSTATAVVSSPNPSLFGEAVTFTATVTDAGGDPVTEGTVTFSEGERTLGPPVPVDAAGRASLTTAPNAFTVGRRTVTATFEAPGWGSSSGSIGHVVHDSAATGMFCNTTPITIPVIATIGFADPYPSQITIGGVDVETLLVTVELAGISHDSAAHVDIMLVGPTGASMVLMSDIGGDGPVSGATLTIADRAASELPAGPIPASGTFRPTNIGVADQFFPPAPRESVGTRLGVFDGLDPNGTWSLFVQDDDPGGVGSIAGGWCLNVVSRSPANVADAGGPYIIAEGDELVLDASASLAGTGASFSWDVDGDGTFGDAAGPTATLSWDELVALGVGGDGSYTVAVEVTDGPTTDTAEAPLTVTETATAVSITGPTSAVVGEPVTLKVSAVDPSPDDLAGTFTYDVDWGDGTEPISVDGPADPPVTHTYTAAGSFTVTATVTTPQGATSEPLTFTIDVAQQAPATTSEPAPTTTAPGALPRTGSSTAEVVTIAVAMVLAGVVTLVRTRSSLRSPGRAGEI